MGQRRRARGVRGPGAFSADVGVWPHVCMRRRARIRVQARASKPARAWVSACAATTRRNDSTARNVHAHATLGTPGGCAVRRHAALPWDTPGCGDMLRHLGILPGALARNKNAHAHATWELLGAVQCGDMLRYLGTLLGALARNRNAHTHSTLGTPGDCVVAETCRATLECSWGRWLIAAGILLEALAARSSDASTPADYTCRETHAHAALGTPGCGAGS